MKAQAVSGAQPPLALLVVGALAAAAHGGSADAAAQGAQGRATPTQQVINMMTDMKAKGEKSMDEEQKTYRAYAEWADDRSKELGFEIQDAQAKIDELVAFISKADADAEKLGREIASLGAEIDRLEGEKKAATANREEEHAEYLALSRDYGESVDALTRAVKELSAQNYDRSQAESLLQRMSSSVPGMQRVLAAFVQEKSHAALRGDGAPEVAAYEFQSGGILELLEGLLKKFSKELSDVEEDEANQAHEFSLVELHLTETIKKTTADRDAKAVGRGKKKAASAKARGELEETKKEKAADEKLKGDIESTFEVKQAQYEQNQKVRADELDAIAKAIEIMSSPEASGSYSKHINLAQTSAASLLQIGRSQTRETARKQAAEFLSKRAGVLNSQVLASFAAQMATKPQSFAKVIDMIETMLERLKEQAAAEADHKAWCDEQLKANKLKRGKKTAQASQLSADIDTFSAEIADMGATIDKLVNQQADLTKAMQEATAQREAEHAENTATIADAAAGIEAVQRAIVVLKEFYSSQSSSLLQQVPEMAAYKGMQSSKGGVIGMLEVIETDFSRLKADTEAGEKAAAEEYEGFMEDAKGSKLKKHEAEVQLRLDKDQAEFERGQTKKDLRATEEELARANKYFEYLKPNCLEVHVNWEERVARRKEEIEALKQAYAILDQKSVG